MKVFTFKNIRIVILLSALAAVAMYTKEQHLNTTSWYKPIEVTIFPINGDGSDKTARYIQKLSLKHFQDIDNFFVRGAKKYRLVSSQPVFTSLGSTIAAHPPSPPKDRSAILQVMWWSMKLRYWAYQNTPDNKSNTDRIRLYLLYHQGKEGQALEHSLGLEKGLIGVIHAYANPKQSRQNALVMAHEILHTVGARDKYNYQGNQPTFPDGYAKPQQQPLHPQLFCEIIAGRIPINATQAEMPKDLRFCLVGETTAKEINWISTL